MYSCAVSFTGSPSSVTLPERVSRRTSPAVEHGQSVHLGQAEIEDDRIIGLGRAEIMAVLAIGGEIDRITGAFEGGAQLAAQIGFVLDDQDPH